MIFEFREYRQCPKCYQKLLTANDFIGEHLKRVKINDSLVIKVRCGGSQTQLRRRLLRAR